MLAWSAVVKSGALVLGPFSQDNLRIYFEEAWPSATWTAEGSAVVPADMTLTSATLTPHRICSQIVVSKRLLIQAAGTPAFDVYLATKMGVALSSMVDQAVLYGQGTAANQPTGVLAQTGTTAVPPVWGDLEALRLAATNQNADLSSFGYITNQTVRKSLATTSRFANAGTSIWDAIAGESEVSLEVNDSRIFAGCWAYATLC